MNSLIPYDDLGLVNRPFEEDFRREFDTILRNGWYILGKSLSDFETAFASFNQMTHCIGVANGLDALILAIRSCHFEKGTEILVPSNTFIATILAILHNGLTPILVEPDPATYNIDPERIEEAVTSRTRAIVPVHLYGKCCDMGKIMDIAERRGLVVIEDAAQAHGARFRDRQSGTFGAIGCFSFYPGKNLGALGDGGAVVTNNGDIARKIRQLRNYGSEVKYHNEEIGYNSRLDEIQAAFLNVKLRSLQVITDHKRMLAKIYLENLKDDYIKPFVHPDYLDVYHIFNIRHPRRDELKEYLLKNGVRTEIHYPVAPHRQNALKEIFLGKSYPVSELIHATTLSLPCSFCHSKDDIFKVVDLLNRF